jgi:hypothetical protein
MFGCEACYLNGKLVLVLADTEEPWNGVLVPVEREHHAVVLAQFPSLVNHPILPKWLYLSAERDDFEFVAQRIIRVIASGDPFYGTMPKEKRPKKKPKRAQRTKPNRRTSRS